eukprot:3936492-Rhodomonas_salina.1
MRMLFEVEDCAVASPATVSRLGVVWIPPEGLGNDAFVKTWQAVYLPERLPEELRKSLGYLGVGGQYGGAHKLTSVRGT